MAATPTVYAAKTFTKPPCAHPVASAPDDAAVRNRSLAMLRRFNITAVTSGPAASVEAWRQADPRRIIPGLEFGVKDAPPIAELRRLHAAGRLQVLGEIGAQYEGAGPSDPRLEPYWALAEELDILVGVYMGRGRRERLTWVHRTIGWR